MTVLITTGGTIAMSGSRAVPTNATAAIVAGLGPDAPRVEAFCDKPSVHLTWDDALALVARVTRLAHAGEPIVVTHGTDVMEETAFLCDLVYDGEPPIVFTGSMRPSGAPSSDGDANLRDAILVAEHPTARGAGALVVFGGLIFGAADVRKRDSVRLDAFASPHEGPVGEACEGRVRLRPRVGRPAPLALPARMPTVEVAWVGLGDEGDGIRALAAAADALVVAVPGAGHVPPAALDAIRQMALHRPVVFCARPERGRILRATYAFPGAEPDLRRTGAICGGVLPSSKARVLVGLCVAAGLSTGEMEAVFRAYDPQWAGGSR
ncbi:MAG: Asparaginase/glutaminase [Solirubrobacterales bacterium]|nr:Asparaginase/glutaminase [Solirubrobacterales bacterium]